VTGSGRGPPPNDIESPTTLEVPGWRRVSTNAPVFAQLAQDLAAKLEARGTAPALALAAQGRSLMSTLQRWASSPPTDHDRTKVMDELVSFNQKASDLLEG
jgi:hypothetical protein